MELWQYRQWSTQQPPAVRTKVDALCDALEVCIDLVTKREKIRDDLGEVLRGLYDQNPIHLWVVVGDFATGPARVLSVVLTEAEAQERARAFRLRHADLHLTVSLQTDDGPLGDVHVTWDEHTLEVPR